MSGLRWIAVDESVDPKMVEFLNFMLGPTMRMMTHFYFLDH